MDGWESKMMKMLAVSVLSLLFISCATEGQKAKEPVFKVPVVKTPVYSPEPQEPEEPKASQNILASQTSSLIWWL